MNSGILSVIKRLVMIVILMVCGASNALSQSNKAQHARVSLLSEHASIAPGGTQWLGLRFELEPGWHIYWTNPGDSGEPPKVTWHLPNGVQAGELQFPPPQRIQDHGLVDYGYEGDVVLLSKIAIPQSLTSGKAEIVADVRYLVCREVCVPARDHVSLSLPIDKNLSPSGQAELIRTAEARLPEPLPRSVQFSATLGQDSFLLTLTRRPANFGSVTDFIPADAQFIDNVQRPVVQESARSSRIRLKKSEQLNQPVSQLRGLLIAGGKAYNVTIPVTSARNPSQRSSTHKGVSRVIKLHEKRSEA